MTLTTTSQGHLPVRVGSWSLGLNETARQYVLECETPPSALVFRPDYVPGQQANEIVATLGYYGVPERVAAELVGELQAVVGAKVQPLRQTG